MSTERRSSAALHAAALAAVFVLAAGSLAAQQASGQKELTIEELFLQSVEYSVLLSNAQSHDLDLAMSALDSIDKKISDGTAKANPEQVVTILELLAHEGSAVTARESGRVVNDFPEVRRRAANLLGRLGTDAAKDALIRVLLIDGEPMVKAEAVYALGVVGKNPNNTVVQAIVYVFNQEDPSRPDNNFGYAVCLALEKLARATPGGLKDRSAFEVLGKISTGNYLRTVRTKALQVLDDLKTVR
jgi:HEAT repeat protein